jgi:hypothetical protein
LQIACGPRGDALRMQLGQTFLECHLLGHSDSNLYLLDGISIE